MQRLQQPLHRPDRAGQDAAAFPSHRPREQKSAPTFFAEQIFFRHLAVFEKHFRHWRRAHAHLLDLARDVHPWRIFLDQEGADSIRAPRFVHRRKHDEQVGDGTIGDEDFAAVEDVFGAFLDRGRGEAECVGAAIRFAHGVAADECAVTKAGQVFFLLCLGAVVDERNDRRPHVGVDGEEQAVILAGVPEPLEGRHGGERILPSPPYSVGTSKPWMPKPPHFFQASWLKTPSRSFSITS